MTRRDDKRGEPKPRNKKFKPDKAEPKPSDRLRHEDDPVTPEQPRAVDKVRKKVKKNFKKLLTK